MLIEFSVGNYRSFKEQVTLSMVAANISSKPESLDEQNIFSVGQRLQLMTSAAVYGANASGKSNLIQALDFMRTFVLTSSRETQITEAIPVEPFRLSTETESQPSFFELVFLVEETQYRYGFEVNSQRVVSEWLYRLGKSREMRLFARNKDEITVTTRNFSEGKALEERTRPNALFLSVVAQFNGKTAVKLLQWFHHLIINTGIHDYKDLFLAVAHFENAAYREDIEQFIKRLDIGIEGFAPERRPATLPQNIPMEVAEIIAGINQHMGNPENINIKTFHRRFDATGQAGDTVSFDLENHESAGTQRLFVLAPPLLHALCKGSVLIIDEMDTRLHPNLVTELIRLFNTTETNPQHAQLVFTTHNTNLLGARLFRRDQIWFIEKSQQGASDLYSLVEYRVDNKVVRNDDSFEKNYIRGRYGAIPFIGDLDELLGAGVEQEIIQEQ
jgi:hypothetical protein